MTYLDSEQWYRQYWAMWTITVIVQMSEGKWKVPSWGEMFTDRQRCFSRVQRSKVLSQYFQDFVDWKSLFASEGGDETIECMKRTFVTSCEMTKLSAAYKKLKNRSDPTCSSSVCEEKQPDVLRWVLWSSHVEDSPDSQSDLLWFRSLRDLQGQQQWHGGLVRTYTSTLLLPLDISLKQKTFLNLYLHLWSGIFCIRHLRCLQPWLVWSTSTSIQTERPRWNPPHQTTKASSTQKERWPTPWSPSSRQSGQW